MNKDYKTLLREARRALEYSFYKAPENLAPYLAFWFGLREKLAICGTKPPLLPLPLRFESYLVLQLSCTCHGRYRSSFTSDVPKHSEHHDTEKQEVERCTGSRCNNEGVLRKLRKSTFFVSIPTPPLKQKQLKLSWADTVWTYLSVFLLQPTRKKIRHFRRLVPKNFKQSVLQNGQAPMNFIHEYKRIQPDCFLLWWPRLCGKDCEVDSLWNKKTFRSFLRKH